MVTKETASLLAINRGLISDNTVYIYNPDANDPYVGEFTDDTSLKDYFNNNPGAYAISKNLFINRTYGEGIQENTSEVNSGSERNIDEGLKRARALFNYFPADIQKAFAENWVEYGESTLAKAATRKSQAWKDEFEYLEREDGSLVMDEITALSTKATYRETLAEVGITDTSEFEDDFNEMIKGVVSGKEFQERIDTVYNAVKNNIPAVEELFRTQYGILTDAPTIFGALINNKINDKLLKGDLQTIGIGAEAKAAGFTGTFTRFENLRKAGLTQEGARSLYQSAGNIQGLGRQTGSEIGIGRIEEAAIGDVDAQKQIGLLAGEAASMSSVRAGAAKKDRKVTGLLES